MPSPKRSASPDRDKILESKRARTDGSNSPHVSAPLELTDEADSGSREMIMPTPHFQARCGLQRSIAMVLKHDGFETATPEAMESLTNLVESYLGFVLEDIKSTTLATRRIHPIPTDFEHTLRRFSLSTSSLKPHLKHPLAKTSLTPEYSDVLPTDPDSFATLPLLGQELSGQADKDIKTYIPTNFPDFPSRHTYSFTLQEDVNIRDPKKTREEAARSAQQGEDALRRLVRASKMRRQKEAKSLVERDTQGKERFRLWELTMRRFMGVDSRGNNTDQVEIADHSMIVNSDAHFSRKEVPRLHKRTAAHKT